MRKTWMAIAVMSGCVAILSSCGTSSLPQTILPTPAQAVTAAKAALTIGYVAGDSASSVTQNVTLPATAANGAVVRWSSSDPGVISTTGVVTRHATSDVSVTLSATITVGSASGGKTFVLTVKAQMTDVQAVAGAKAALQIGYAPGDAASSVTQNVSLPVAGLDGCTVSWSSSTPSVVSTNGTVTQSLTGDVLVTLTATIRLNAATTSKVFIVTVKAEMTDAQAVAAAKAALQIGYAAGDSASSVTQNLNLPLTGSEGCTVRWSSSNAPVISNSGVVQRPAEGNTPVMLTATISSNAVSDTAEFTVDVVGQISDAAAVAAAKAALQIGYAAGDSAASVTQNVTLVASGADACSIAWSSDTPAVISNSGVVVQPAGSPAVVTLTATISSHAVSDTEAFVLDVQPAMSDAAAVEADKAALTIGYGPGDSAASVTGNLVLPTSGTHGSTITWASNNPVVISPSGGVTVPSDSDVSVTMTATIARGVASDTAIFPLTVKAMLLSSWVDVTKISPGNGAIEVDPGIIVGIPFQRALDASTVNNTTFQLIQTSNSQAVPVVVSYDAVNKMVSLTPQSELAQATQFTTIVGTTLKDGMEASLPSSMQFNFTTLSYADILAQWKFDGDGSDASGNGNDLTNISGTFDTEIVHQGSASLYLNSADGTATSNIDLGTQLTVAVWVNVDNPIQPSINTIMANTGTDEEANGFKLCINHWNTSDQSVVIEVGDGMTGGKWITAPGLIQPGNWYHVAFVIDEPNQVMKIYYNGVQAPLSFTSDQGYTVDQFHYDFSTSGPFTIGAFPVEAYYFKGHLDDMRVYNRILSDDEIAKIAQEN